MKRTLALALTIVLAFTFAACGGNSGGESNPSPTDSDSPTGGGESNSSPPNSDSPTDGGGLIDGNPPPSGLTETPAADFTYKYEAALSGVVITKYTGTSLQVRIPEKIEDMPVVSIGTEAFEDSGITYVYIPNTITAIGSSAFANCKGLTNVTLPASLKTGIGGAFIGCSDIVLDKLYIKPLSSSTAVGDIVSFGQYGWRVLDVQGGRALLLSEDILENRAYNTEYTDITWEDCTLRSYLNNDFINSAFSEGEQAKIIETNVTNDANPNSGISGGNNTSDKVFLLSIAEAEQYFNSSSARMAYFENSASWWWLRSPGLSSSAAFGVSDSYVYGGSHYDNRDVSLTGGVRPALWLNL
ncbi:MAG: leucine-rich repeat domain-containing protein [Oscillospiraceae bacterium]|jgi:hypothetical protein|nr:leucine-rich repeat domain-containing protein [Oscillospiraceae bacterium]